MLTGGSAELELVTVVALVECACVGAARGATVTVSCTCDLEHPEASITHAPMPSDNKTPARVVRPSFLPLSTLSCMSSPYICASASATPPIAARLPLFPGLPFRRKNKSNVYTKRWSEKVPRIGHHFAEAHPTMKHT